jgi:hypothetical protein
MLTLCYNIKTCQEFPSILGGHVTNPSAPRGDTFRFWGAGILFSKCPRKFCLILFNAIPGGLQKDSHQILFFLLWYPEGTHQVSQYKK